MLILYICTYNTRRCAPFEVWLAAHGTALVLLALARKLWTLESLRFDSRFKFSLSLEFRAGEFAVQPRYI
jgi:hypothetical protein